MAIRTGQSDASDALQAAQEFHAAVSQPDMALVVFFCSSDYDLKALAPEIQRLFAGTQVIGCTTAGEIGPAGCLQHSISGASYPSGEFAAATGWLGNLQTFELAQGQALAQRLLQEVEHRAPSADAENSFVIQLIDGLSMREELVTNAMQAAFDKIPLVGGSAADCGQFVQTFVYADGAFHADSVAFALVTTSRPFRTFRIQHFLPTDERLVITEAEPSLRKVSGIDGWLAAEEYARRIGSDVEGLDAAAFAANPIVVVIDGTDFVRSVQKSNIDGSLTFYSAMEEGLVLRIARGGDLLQNMEQAFDGLREGLGEIQSVIAFDCILRQREISEAGLTDQVTAVFGRNNAVGFNTYGEQTRGVHVNQTLTGIAIGANDG
jgi:hypothetical protein